MTNPTIPAIPDIDANDPQSVQGGINAMKEALEILLGRRASGATDYVLEHGSRHGAGADDEIDGDMLDIDFTPTNYTPATTPKEADSEDHLAAHLQGIDIAVGSAAADHAGTHVTGGGDTIANAIAAGNSGLMSGADKTKIDGVEAGAEANNISDVNATDLTDGGDTTLHDHDGISENTAARHAAEHASNHTDGTDDIQTASTSQKGLVAELTTDAEAIAGTDTTRAVTAAALKAKLGTQTAGALLVGDTDSNALDEVAPSALGKVLVDQGSGNDPAYEYRPIQNLLRNSGFSVVSNSELTSGAGSGRQTDFNESEKYADDDGSTFASWTATDCTVTDGGGNLVITETGATQNLYINVVSLEVGNRYKVSLITADGTGAWAATDFMHIRAAGGGAPTASIVYADLSAGTHSLIFTATAVTHAIRLAGLTLGAGETLNITSLYMDEVAPGRVTADTLAADGHSKTATLDWWQAHNNASYCPDYYGLKTKKGADGAEYYNLLNLTDAVDYIKHRGQTVAFGIKGYSVTVADNVKIQIYDGVDTTESAFWGADAKVWKEITHAVNAAATQLTMRILLDGDTNDIAYFSLDTGAKGGSIGEDNYSPKPNEIINLEKNVALIDYAASAVAADATINLEAQSNGMIPKGCRAVHGWIEGQNSTADKYIDILSESGGVRATRMYSQVDDKDVAQPFRAICDSSGNIYIDVEDGNWTNVTIQINAVEI